MTDQIDILSIASKYVSMTLEDACAGCQRELGIKTGDGAAHFFSGHADANWVLMPEAQQLDLLMQWLQQEIQQEEQSPMGGKFYYPAYIRQNLVGHIEPEFDHDVWFFQFRDFPNLRGHERTFDNAITSATQHLSLEISHRLKCGSFIPPRSVKHDSETWIIPGKKIVERLVAHDEDQRMSGAVIDDLVRVLKGAGISSTAEMAHKVGRDPAKFARMTRGHFEIRGGLRIIMNQIEQAIPRHRYPKKYLTASDGTDDYLIRLHEPGYIAVVEWNGDYATIKIISYLDNQPHDIWGKQTLLDEGNEAAERLFAKSIDSVERRM